MRHETVQKERITHQPAGITAAVPYTLHYHSNRLESPVLGLDGRGYSQLRIPSADCRTEDQRMYTSQLFILFSIYLFETRKIDRNRETKSEKLSEQQNIFKKGPKRLTKKDHVLRLN